MQGNDRDDAEELNAYLLNKGRRKSGVDLMSETRLFLLQGAVVCEGGKEDGSDKVVISQDLSSRTIFETTRTLLSHYDEEKRVHEALRSQALSVQGNVSQVLKEIDCNIIEKYRKYIDLKNKIQLMNLARALKRLQHFHSVLEIPDLVLGVMENVPMVLPHQSQIRQLLMDTAENVKATLLSSFHERFESHLQAENDDNNDSNLPSTFDNNSNSSHKNNNNNNAWSLFLSETRDWLLSYSLISLLPFVLTESSKTLVMEKYQEALDEALTPLWGRFHFHLSCARETSSSEQILWTFPYSCNFIEMLVRLCTQITTSDKLQRLQVGNYRKAALQHVVDKCTRFLRAHVAQILVNRFSSVSGNQDRNLLISVVEECLQLDSMLMSTLSSTTCAEEGVKEQKMTKGQVEIRMTITSVLCDAKIVQEYWMKDDNQFFATVLGKCLVSSSPAPFSLRFDGGMGKCYSCIYECLHLFSMAVKRYSFLPASAQNNFSQVVLEPILCAAVTLMLMHIRSNPTLSFISAGRGKFGGLHRILNADARTSTSTSTSTNTFVKECPSDLKHFLFSVDYFHAALGAITEDEQYCNIRSDSMRFDDLWSEVYSWVPKRQEFKPTEGTTTHSSFTPTHACKKIFSRALDIPSRQESSKSDITKLTLAATIGVARSQVAVFSSVLENGLT